MNDFNAIATAYLEAFNATDAGARRRIIEKVFAPEVRYVDPMAAVDGHDGVDAFIAGAHEQFPGWTFALVGQVDGHHDQARFGWSLGPDGAEPAVLGFDVVNLDAQGRITAVHGFLDRVPGA